MNRIVSTLLCALFLGCAPVWALPVDVSSGEPHRVQSIETGTAALQLRLEMIERAEVSIDVEYFIFDNSDASRILVEALIRKKAEKPGVRIRMLLDYFALSKSLNAYYTTALMKKGIEIKYYNQSFMINLKKVSRRNHRKVLLVDKKEGIVGGRNMADEYYDLRTRYNFLDRDVWVEGPISESIAQSFEYFWNAKQSKYPVEPSEPVRSFSGSPHRGSYQADLSRYRKNLKEADWFSSVFNKKNEEDARLLSMRKEFKRIGQRLLKEEPVYEVNSVRFISDGPDWDNNADTVTGKAYYQLMEQAQNNILIETPYFYLQKAEKEYFAQMKNRGVEVDLLLNSKNVSNEFAINFISLLQGLQFSKMGFSLWLNQGKFVKADNLVIPKNAETAMWMLHAKTMLADDNISWIGTLNMDPRSIQRINAELALVVDNEAFNSAVKGHMKHRQNSGIKVKDGKTRKAHEDPSEHENLWSLIKSIKTIPFYTFENQI